MIHICSTLKVSDVLKPRHSFVNVQVNSKQFQFYTVYTAYTDMNTIHAIVFN